MKDEKNVPFPNFFREWHCVVKGTKKWRIFNVYREKCCIRLPFAISFNPYVCERWIQSTGTTDAIVNYQYQSTLLRHTFGNVASNFARNRTLLKGRIHVFFFSSRIACNRTKPVFQNSGTPERVRNSVTAVPVFRDAGRPNDVARNMSSYYIL